MVGGRSSVLAPLPALGCVVVDDEANFAHKEQRTPRFHAREVALRRAATGRALCVLTGTVPSAEALAAMQAGQCRLLTPDRAAERAARPLVEVVDPDDEGPTAARLHPRALAAVRAALGRDEPAYVLVPRRGGAKHAQLHRRLTLSAQCRHREIHQCFSDTAFFATAERTGGACQRDNQAAQHHAEAAASLNQTSHGNSGGRQACLQ